MRVKFGGFVTQRVIIWMVSYLVKCILLRLPPFFVLCELNNDLLGFEEILIDGAVLVAHALRAELLAHLGGPCDLFCHHVFRRGAGAHLCCCHFQNFVI